MLLLIDNYDSFTYNLYQSFMICSKDQLDIQVVRNDALTISEILRRKPSALVISPGPGKPSDTGVCRAVLEHFVGSIPILGVCLGYQLIAELFGAQVKKSPTPLHGKASSIVHSGTGLFEAVRPNALVARYHSLKVEGATLSDEFAVDAVTKEDGELMAISHKEHRLFGFQFHPESFLTEDGNLMVSNFLDRVER